MDNPSNGVSIVGCLVPAFGDEESYLRRAFHCEDYDEYDLDFKGTYKSKLKCSELVVIPSVEVVVYILLL